MLMPGPQRYDKRVTFLPAERFAVDDRRAAATEGVVNAGAGVAVGFGFFVGPAHSNAARCVP